MVATSDRIRQDIEDTRSRLSREIDELADRTLPHRIVKRHWPVRRGRAGPDAGMAAVDPGPNGRPSADDEETDSVLDPEPNDVTDEIRRSVRGRLVLAGIAAAGVTAAVVWLLRSRSRRNS